MNLFLTLVLLYYASEAKFEDPGIKGRVTLKGFQYGLQAGIEKVKTKLPTLQIPDVKGQVPVPVLGSISYWVTRIKIQDLDLSQSDVSLSANTGLKLVVAGAQIRITGDLAVRTPLFSARTLLELLVRDLSISGVIGVTRDDLGHGAVWNAGCSSSAGRVDLRFHGGAGWLLSMFQSAMLGPIHDALNKHLCPEFDELVMHMEQIMRTLPVAMPVDSVAVVEFPLVVAPLVTVNILELAVKGQFVGISQRWETPYTPEKLVLPDLDSRMLLLAVSQFSANSAGYVHYKSGALVANVTDNMIPPKFPLRLNTKSLGIFAPELPHRFPDSPPLLLQVSARSPPSVSCHPDSLTLQFSADILIYAMYSEKPAVPLLQMQADGEFQVEILLSEESLGAGLTARNFSLSLVSSHVGPVKVSELQNIVSLALKVIVCPLLNEQLSKGFHIPARLLRLKNPSIRVLQGYLVIVTDFEVST